MQHALRAKKKDWTKTRIENQASEKRKKGSKTADREKRILNMART